MPLMMVLGGAGAEDNGALVMAIIVALIFFIVGLIVLIIYNVFLRMYFELVLLFFNMYDELKTINANTKKKEEKAATAAA
jgi:biopolymer transport protein ExbB/TolQ